MQQVLELALAHKERGHHARGLKLLGDVMAAASPADPGAAEDSYRQALALTDELAMRPLTAQILLGLGQLYQRTGGRPRRRTGSPTPSCCCMTWACGPGCRARSTSFRSSVTCSSWPDRSPRSTTISSGSWALGRSRSSWTAAKESAGDARRRTRRSDAWVTGDVRPPSTRPARARLRRRGGDRARGRERRVYLRRSGAAST